MSDFLDTLYKSFSSAVPSFCEQHGLGQPEEITVYAEMQILKVTAPKQDLEKFTNEIARMKEKVGIKVKISVLRPSPNHERRMKEMEQEEKENYDFLDYVFSDTIPFLHEFLIYGSPEAQFFQIKGKRSELDMFNKLCSQVIHGKELQCKLEVTDRRKISIRKQFKNSILGGPNSTPDLLDALFTDDLSSSNPTLHNMILSVY